MRSVFAVGVVSGLLAAAAPAQLLDVPGTYPTIQAALDAAQDGDTILVQPGTYIEPLVFPATSLTLESAAGAAATIVDATGLQARVMLIAPAAPAAITVAVRGFTIAGGHVLDEEGAGVYVGSTAAVTVEDCFITDNVVDGTSFFFGGGGVYAAGATQLTACEIRDNQVLGLNGMGGGVAGLVTLTDCLLAGNSASYAGGGGMGGTYSHCTFEANVAGGPGGGLYGFMSGVATDCLFRDNVAGSTGGGCSLSSVGGLIAHTQVWRCTFLGNVAASGGGAWLSADADMIAATVSLIDCIFAGNEAPFGDGASASTAGPGGGMSCVRFCTFVGDGLQVSHDLSMSHCIARDPPPGGPFVSLTGGTINVTWSDVAGGWPGLGNFDADPLFADPAGEDFHLGPQSPCTDAGDPAYVPSTVAFGCSWPDMDVDGQPRPLGGLVDVGADETEPDCNQNGLGDLSEILAGTATDCDGDLVLDECQPFADCNGNGQFDACDIAQGLAVDCNGNWVPDDCEPFRDCNGNGQLDECDIASGRSSDCDHDGVPDDCQAFADCNDNGQFDACDIQSGTSHDCNGNGVPDECDIASGASVDADANGWPDECEAVLQVPADFATIQSAIDAAEDGDAIELADGTYTGTGNVELDFLGKELLLEGTAGACIIECANARFARLGAADSGGVQLRGLKILHGAATQGGAVLCEDGAVLEAHDCVFEHNLATLGGGAVFVRNGASATFRGCAFLGNQGQNGGGLRVSAATALVEHATFSNNSASGKGGGVGAAQGGLVTVRDSIFQLDTAGNGPELQADGAGSLIEITYSDVVGGLLATNATGGAHFIWGAGMIEADPLLADVPLDLHLLPGSPCINTGDPAGPPDADGSPPDMGALPYEPWTLLGGGVAGTFGQAQLTANGPLTADSVVEWKVGKGLHGGAFTLVAGFAEAGLAFHGGILWPEPQALILLSFDDHGAAQGHGRWPPGVPLGTGLWLQAWFADDGAAGGLAASNGVRGLAP